VTVKSSFKPGLKLDASGKNVNSRSHFVLVFSYNFCENISLKPNLIPNFGFKPNFI